MVENKEVIINALDLASFLLITPEILRVVQPSISSMFTYLLIAIGALVLSTVMFKVGLTKIYYTDDIVSLHEFISYWVSWRALLSLTIAGLVILLIIVPVVSTVEIWLSKHMFAIGVITFLLSRVIALIVALYGSGNAE